jgi:hypothetical protein
MFEKDLSTKNHQRLEFAPFNFRPTAKKMVASECTAHLLPGMFLRLFILIWIILSTPAPSIKRPDPIANLALPVSFDIISSVSSYASARTCQPPADRCRLQKPSCSHPIHMSMSLQLISQRPVWLLPLPEC